MSHRKLTQLNSVVRGTFSELLQQDSPSPWLVLRLTHVFADSKVHGANMGPTWVLSAPDGPPVGPMNLAIRVSLDLALKFSGLHFFLLGSSYELHSFNLDLLLFSISDLIFLCGYLWDLHHYEITGVKLDSFHMDCFLTIYSCHPDYFTNWLVPWWGLSAQSIVWADNATCDEFFGECFRPLYFRLYHFVCDDSVFKRSCLTHNEWAFDNVKFVSLTCVCD